MVATISRAFSVSLFVMVLNVFGAVVLMYLNFAKFSKD
jgi:hypothetical protein